MTEKKKPSFSLKDQLFNRERVEYLAGLLSTSVPNFDASRFANETMEHLPGLELKQRIVWIASKLEAFLSPNFDLAVKQICQALPPPLDPNRTDDDFGDFIFAPLGEYVVRNGMESKHVKRSLRTLKELTQRFSMEDAIRAFLNEHTEVTLRELEKWANHKNYHVRRLVSEGTRPKLPWSKRLTFDVTVPLRLLDALHADPTRYVTRSVSNHLNDIAKTHPDLVVATLRNWQEIGKQDDQELRWMCRHALRTLVKQGNEDALRLLGFRPDPKIKVAGFALKTTKIRPGESIEFSFVISASRDESVMVDYVIDFMKANGKHAPKVHKLKQFALRKGESHTVTKRHRLHADATTYKLYAGEHHVTLQINGKSYGTETFEVK